MPSFFSGLAEQALSAVSDRSSQDVHQTGGQRYNAPNNGHQSQGGGRYDTQEVLSHVDTDNQEDRGYIANAVQHVHNNPEQHHEQVSEGDLSQYGPLIMNALSSLSSKHGMDISSLVSGGLGQGGGNKLMGLVMKEAGNFVGGASGQEKQSLMNGAAMTLTKLVAQKQLSGLIGGSNSGGLGGMMSMGQSLLKNFK